MLGPRKIKIVDYSEDIKRESIKVLDHLGYWMMRNQLFVNDEGKLFIAEKRCKPHIRIRHLTLYFVEGKIKKISYKSTKETYVFESWDHIPESNHETHKVFQLDFLDKLKNLPWLIHRIQFIDSGTINIHTECRWCRRSKTYNQQTFEDDYSDILKSSKCCVYNEKFRRVSQLNANEMFKNSETGAVITGTYAGECINGHKFMIPHNDYHKAKTKAQGMYYKKYKPSWYSPSPSPKPPLVDVICPICEIIPKYKFFKIMNKLNVIYKIEETFSNRNIHRCKDLRILSKLDILIYNKSNHIIGKIVFDDYDGYKQAQSNKNSVVFGWMDINQLDNETVCLNFLGKIHKKILEQHGLENSSL